MSSLRIVIAFVKSVTQIAEIRTHTEIWLRNHMNKGNFGMQGTGGRIILRRLLLICASNVV
jgi:hypothetical protein